MTATTATATQLNITHLINSNYTVNNNASTRYLFHVIYLRLWIGLFGNILTPNTREKFVEMLVNNVKNEKRNTRIHAHQSIHGQLKTGPKQMKDVNRILIFKITNLLYFFLAIWRKEIYLIICN